MPQTPRLHSWALGRHPVAVMASQVFLLWQNRLIRSFFPSSRTMYVHCALLPRSRGSPQGDVHPPTTPPAGQLLASRLSPCGAAVVLSRCYQCPRRRGMLPEEVWGGVPPPTSSGSIPHLLRQHPCPRRRGMLPEEVWGGVPPPTSSGSIPHLLRQHPCGTRRGEASMPPSAGVHAGAAVVLSRCYQCPRRRGMLPEEVWGGVPPPTSSGSIPHLLRQHPCGTRRGEASMPPRRRRPCRGRCGAVSLLPMPSSAGDAA